MAMICMVATLKTGLRSILVMLITMEVMGTVTYEGTSEHGPVDACRQNEH